MQAMIRFEAGPARATATSPFRRSRRFEGLTGVGLAQPKSSPLPDRAVSTRSSPPNGSKWTIGLRVSRPNTLAVPSPSR